MGWLTKLLATLLVGILSAALATIFQNDIAAYFGRAPITAEITAGAWYPYYHSDERRPFDKADEEAIADFSHRKELKFARINIYNRSGRIIPNVYFVIDGESDSSWAAYKAVVLKGKNGQESRTIQSEPTGRVDLGEMEPASSLTAYVWSNRTFGYPFDFDDLVLVSTDGVIPTTVNRFSGDATSYVFGIHTEHLAWVLLLTTLLIGFVLVFGLAQQWKFIRAMLSSEDYYLEQRQSYDAEPKKFVLPDSIPKPKIS